MVFFVMLGISVFIAVLAQLPLLEFVREVSRRSNRFGIAFDTDCGVDIFLGNVGIDCAGGKHMIGQVRCPCRERKSQRHISAMPPKFRFHPSSLAASRSSM